MRQVLRPAKISAILVCVVFTVTPALFFNSCKKDSKNQLEKEDSEIATKKPGTGKLPGPCPYDCHDPACIPYSDYCGSGSGGGGSETPEVSVTSLQNQTDINLIISSFQNLQVNFSQLSLELGLNYTLSINDINFQNSSSSYVTNDIGLGEALVAPFQTNSSNNSVNYAFCITVDNNYIYKPYIIKVTTNQSLQYFDLDEGYILTVNNYDNSSNVSCQTTTGNYLNTSNPNSTARLAACGQGTMNCINDAYTNHGWTSVYLFVQSIFIPQTGVAIAAACAIKNCIPRQSR